MDKNKREMVSHPDHYDKGNKTYEPYRVIEAWECNFNIGSAIKYLARYQDKWDPIEDLEKAKQYIDFEIERLKERCPGRKWGENFPEREEQKEPPEKMDDIGVIPAK